MDPVRLAVCLALHMGQLRLNDQLADARRGGFELRHGRDRAVGRDVVPSRRSPQDEALSIRRSTEGWVAGVKLALLAAAESRDGIGDFNGSHS